MDVLVDQDVLALEVSVGDGGLSLRAEDLHMEVSHAAGDGQGHAEAARRVHGALLQEVVQGAHLVEVRYQPQLRARVPRRHVRRDEACRRRSTRNALGQN